MGRLIIIKEVLSNFRRKMVYFINYDFIDLKVLRVLINIICCNLINEGFKL